MPHQERPASPAARSSGLRLLTLQVSLNEALVIRRCVNATARMLDDADMNPPPEREDAQLLQSFQLFEWFRRQHGQAEQKTTAISVQAEVLQETRRLALEVGQAIADKGDWTTAEIQRPPAGVVRLTHFAEDDMEFI